MKLENGKYYRLRNGERVGPIAYVCYAGHGSYFQWLEPIGAQREFYWRLNGEYGGDCPAFDIVGAWIDEVVTAVPAPITKREVLEKAIEAVADRGLNYGKPEDNFARIAVLWNAHIENGYGIKGPLRPDDVAIMMALMKIARLENDPSHLDSWTDLAGYAACGAEIAAKKA